MKVLRKRITKDNLDEAIYYCKDWATRNPNKWKDKYESGYMYASELLDLIAKEKLIIHIYTDGEYEFKFIEKVKRRKDASI
jgi:hypothetical protein